MLSCDVLVVGGGGAALRAAIAACQSGSGMAKVLIACKGKLGASGVTATACSDRMAFHATLPTTEPGGPDAWRYHADDIYRIGGAVSDAHLAEVLAQGAQRAFEDLDAWGMPWARRADGTVDQFVTDGSEYARACYTGPYTANHIEEALLAQVRDLPIEVLERQVVADLVLAGTVSSPGEQRVAGALLVSQETDDVIWVRANAVVLATGGAGQAWDVSVFPPDCTGDGYAMAYRAGAELVNLEFIQIGLSSLATNLACSGSMMRALPRVVDENDDEILPRYLPDPADRYATLFAKGASWPVSLRDASHRIDIAVANELAAGHRVFLDYGTDPVDLDWSALPESLTGWYCETKEVPPDGVDISTPLERLLAINQPSVQWLRERGIDLTAGERIEIAPAIQHFQGGIKIGTEGQTTVAGVFAAGEVAGGQHGANRPGGNALLDGQVFGRIAGEQAAAFGQAIQEDPLGSQDLEDMAPAQLDAMFTPDGLRANDVRAEVRALLSANAGVLRTKEGLSTAVARLDEIARRGVSREGSKLCEAVEALNMLQVAQMVALPALARDESRGPHLRFDATDPLIPIPRKDPVWQRYTVISRGPDGPLLDQRDPVRPTDR